MKIISLGSSQQLPETPDAGNFKILELPNTSEETTPQSLLRQATGAVSTGLKTAIDLPGNLVKGAASLANLGISDKEERFDTGLIPNISEYTIEPIEKAVLPQGYTQPREGEESTHEFASDLVNLAFPLGGKFKPLKAVGTALAGGFAKWAGQELGLSKSGAEGLKLGTMLATSMLGPSKLSKQGDALYKEATEAVPIIAPKVSANKLEPLIADLESALAKGMKTESKKIVQKTVKAARKHIVDGEIGIDQVMELKRNVNEDIRRIANPQGLEKKLPVVSHKLADILTDYGHTNKHFGIPWAKAEDITQGLMKASPVNAFLQKHVSAANLGKITGSMLLGAVAGHAFGADLKPSVAGGTSLIAAMLATRGGVKVLERALNSATIRNSYKKVIAAAAKQKVPQFSKFVQELDDDITKEFPENY